MDVRLPKVLRKTRPLVAPLPRLISLHAPRFKRSFRCLNELPMLPTRPPRTPISGTSPSKGVGAGPSAP